MSGQNSITTELQTGTELKFTYNMRHFQALKTSMNFPARMGLQLRKMKFYGSHAGRNVLKFLYFSSFFTTGGRSENEKSSIFGSSPV